MKQLTGCFGDPRVIVVLALALLLSGAQLSCKNRSRAMSAQLRDQVHELKSENEALRRQQEELETQLKASMASQSSLSPVIGNTAVPVVTRIMVDRASGRRTTPDSTGQRPLEIYIGAVDGRNRPIQLAGTMRVKVTQIQEVGPPIELVDFEMSPDELRDAWRGGLVGGPTWLASIPLDDSDLGPNVDSLNVRVFYRDLRTGALLECGDEVDIR